MIYVAKGHAIKSHTDMQKNSLAVCKNLRFVYEHFPRALAA